MADNLDNETYETFERDTIKYKLYELSLEKAFLDKKKYGVFLQTRNCEGPQYIKSCGDVN